MSAEHPVPVIRHERAGQRFLLDVDGHLAHLDYESGDGVMVITHTIVPAPIAGRGIAGQLMQAVLEFAGSEQLMVDPQCSYADAWMRKHSQFETLRA